MSINTVSGIVALKSPSHAGDSRIADLDELAKFHIAQKPFGVRWVYARALLILHWLTLDVQGGGSSSSSGSGIIGGVNSEKEGDLSRSFNSIISASDPNGYLKSTSFGAELLQLWKSCLILPMSRRVGEID